MFVLVAYTQMFKFHIVAPSIENWLYNQNQFYNAFLTFRLTTHFLL